MDAKPGDKDLLSEIQGIESLEKPLFYRLDTSFLENRVVHWLQVGDNSFLQVEQMINLLVVTEMAGTA